MNKAKKKTVNTMIIMALIAVIAVVAFYLIINQGAGNSKKLKTEVEQLLEKNIDADYPKTPREVLKLYTRITQAIYGEKKVSGKSLEPLLTKMRELFDTELLEQNSLQQQLEDSKKDLEEYKKDGKSIVSYDIDNNSSVKYETREEREYAVIDMDYFVKDKKGYQKTYEQFILRKDSEGKWKILGWKLTQPSNIESE